MKQCRKIRHCFCNLRVIGCFVRTNELVFTSAGKHVRLNCTNTDSTVGVRLKYGWREVMLFMNRNRFLMIPLVLAVAGSMGLSGCRKNSDEENMVMDAGPSVETAVRTDIENVYTAKGKIISGQESSMNVKGASGSDALIIDQVYVQVGDLVKAGDVLYTLDLTDTQKDLAMKEQQQAISDQQNALTQSANQRALSDAQAESGDQYTSGTNSLLRSAEDTNKAIEQQVQDQQKLQEYKDEETRTKATYDLLQSQVDSLQADADEKDAKLQSKQREYELQSKQREYEKHMIENSAAGSSSENEQKEEQGGQKQESQGTDLKTLEIQQLEARYAAEDAKAALTKAQTALSEAKTAYETAKGKRETYENTVKSDQTATTSGVRALEDQGMAVNKGNRSVLSAEQAARNAIASQNLSHQSDLLTSESEIAKLKEKLENGQVIATMDGTVTAVNVVAGQAYSGTDGVVLDNLSKMKVSADIDEAHIADLHVGTRVRVKTDSTGAAELEGTVTFTSPTPTKETANTGSGTGSSSSSGNSQNTKTRATYKVEVTLDEPNDRLRIGMTANIDFIVASAKNVIAVPTSCLIDDGNGNYFVNVVQGDASGASFGTTGDGMTDGSAGDMQDGMTDASGDSSMGTATEVMVTTGVADDYYTEITSGNIQEGEQIQSSMPYDSGDYSDMMSGIYDTQ